MDRRRFVRAMMVAAAGAVVQRAAFAHSLPQARNAVLVHGLFAEWVMLDGGDTAAAGGGPQCHLRAESVDDP